MAAENGADRTNGHQPVMRTFARGWLAKPPEFARSDENVAVCRLLVIGEVPGPASGPPRVSLYLKGVEAERCAHGLRQGDLIEAVGFLGPERERAPRQEVLVDGRVKLRAGARAAPGGSGGRSREAAGAGGGGLTAAVVHCRQKPFDVYIGRGPNPRTGEPGEWGNRYSLRPSRVPGVIVVATVEKAVAPLEHMAALDGETLGCWCWQPGPCHG